MRSMKKKNKAISISNINMLNRNGNINVIIAW